MTKPRNFNTRKWMRREGALVRLNRVPAGQRTDEQRAEIATLKQRLSYSSANFSTKKLQATATYARQKHRAGKITH